MVSIKFAVSESWFLVQSAISPAPTKTGGATTVTATVSIPEIPPLFVTVTGTRKDATVEYTCAALIGAAWLAVLPVLDVPSPQLTVYPHGPSLGSGSLKLAERVTVSPGFVVMSGPALTVGRAPWQLAEPESLNVFPATGTNCQAYPPSSRVSFRTPKVPLFRTWLFGR